MLALQVHIGFAYAEEALHTGQQQMQPMLWALRLLHEGSMTSTCAAGQSNFCVNVTEPTCVFLGAECMLLGSQALAWMQHGLHPFHLF